VAIDWLVSQVIAQGQPGDHYTPGFGQGALYLFPSYDLIDQAVIDQVNETLDAYKADPASRPNLKIRQDL
jgi:hypothetical protein